MLRKKVSFVDNLVDYDTLGNWDVYGDDASYASNNDYLVTYKTNSDIYANFLDLTDTMNEIYNFGIETDVKMITQASGNDMKFLELQDAGTVRGSIKLNNTSNRLQFFDEDEAQIGSNYPASGNAWYRTKLVQNFNQQSSTTGKLSAYVKDLSDPDNDWEFIGTNSTQSSGINDVRIGHPENSGETYEYQFKNLIIYETEEFP